MKGFSSMPTILAGLICDGTTGRVEMFGRTLVGLLLRVFFRVIGSFFQPGLFLRRRVGWWE